VAWSSSSGRRNATARGEWSTMLERRLSGREIRKLVATVFEADPSFIGAPRFDEAGDAGTASGWSFRSPRRGSSGRAADPAQTRASRRTCRNSVQLLPRLIPDYTALHPATSSVPRPWTKSWPPPVATGPGRGVLSSEARPAKTQAQSTARRSIADRRRCGSGR
jgi:hypothetical protein